MYGKAVAKNAVFLLIGVVGTFFAYRFLLHISPDTYRVVVIFKDAKGLVKQSFVRMQGVQIGEVESVDLNTEVKTKGHFGDPQVTLKIYSKYSIPKNSRFRVVSGILITSPTIEIIPGDTDLMLMKTNVARVTGEETGGALEALSPELASTVKRLNASFDGISEKLNGSYGKINKILDSTQTLLITSNKTIGKTGEIIGDPKEVRLKLISTLDNFKQVSQQASGTAVDLRKQLNGLLASSKGNLDELRQSLLNIFDRLDTTLDDANTVVKKLTEQVTDPRLQSSLQETLDLGRTTLARFNQIASDLHQITGDPQLQTDLKSSVTNLQNASKSGSEAVEKVNNLLGGLTGKDGKAKKFTPPQFSLFANASEGIDPGVFRADIEGRLGFGSKEFLQAGIYDVGQNARLNLQLGRKLNDRFSLRYGIFASKLGAGLDYQFNPTTSIRTDLYDTRTPRLDFRTLFRVNKDAYLWIGADSLFSDPHPRIGIQLTR